MKIRVLKTNRKIKGSPYLTACKEQDGLLGNIELRTMMTFDSVVSDFYVDPGSNLKYINPTDPNTHWWKFW